MKESKSNWMQLDFFKRQPYKVQYLIIFSTTVIMIEERKLVPQWEEDGDDPKKKSHILTISLKFHFLFKIHANFIFTS